MAFAAFADAPVEAGIVEVGLGGRWDATNVVDGTVAVITPIGLDHAEYLGTRRRSASPGRRPGSSSPAPSRCWPRRTGRWPRCCSSAAPRWARRSPARARSSGCASGRSPSAGSGSRLQGLGGPYDDIFLPLHGEHQAGNAALALAAAEALVGRRSAASRWTRTRSARRSPRCARRAGWSGSPPGADVATVLVDAAHNPHGARALAAALTTEFRVHPAGRRGRR